MIRDIKLLIEGIYCAAILGAALVYEFWRWFAGRLRHDDEAGAGIGGEEDYLP